MIVGFPNVYIFFSCFDFSGDINGFVYPNLEPKYVCDVNDLGSDHDVL